MYTITFVEEIASNLNYSFIEVDTLPVDDVKEIFSFTRNGKILKIEEGDKKELNRTKLYNFVTPEAVFLATQQPGFMISTKAIQYLVRNWDAVYKDESTMFYIERVKSVLKPLL